MSRKLAPLLMPELEQRTWTCPKLSCQHSKSPPMVLGDVRSTRGCPMLARTIEISSRQTFDTVQIQV
eukprot:6367642-Pyramimonas_sp.AAC.1